MSLTTKHTFALSPVCLSTKETFALLRSTGKLSVQVLFVLFLLTSQFSFSQNPIAGNQGFQILSEGNFTSTNSHHIHGSMAVGGNLIINSSFLGEVNMDNTGSYVFSGDGSVPTGLLVKGSVTWTAGMMKVGDGNYIHVGNSTGSITSNNGGTGLTQVLPTGAAYNSAKRIEASINQPTNVFQTVGFDFTTLFNNYRSTSTTLSSQTNNVQLYNTSNVAIAGNAVSSAQSVRVNSLNNGVNYLNLTTMSLNNITEIVFNDQPSISKVLIINVPVTTNFTWNNVNMTSLSGATNGAYVLWNFYGGATYNLTINQAALVIGTIYAPNMNVIKAGTGDIEGNIIAKTVQLGTGEIHNYQFASDLLNFTTCSCTGNLLTNPGFETSDFTGWTLATNDAGQTSFAGDNTYAVCGTRYAYFNPTAGNATDYVSYYQNVTASAGQTYSFSIYAGVHDASKDHQLRLQFFNSSNVLLSGGEVQQVDNIAASGLIKYTLAGTAPTGTAYVRVTGYASGAWSGASVALKIDAACLTLTSSVCSPPNITAISNSPVCLGSTIHFETQSTTSGVTYSWTGPNGFTSSNEQYPCVNTAQTINGGTYTAMATLNGCTATATVNVVINNTVAPSPPTVPNVYKCAAGTATFTASNCAGTVNWFTADWTYLGSGSTFTTSSLSQNTQYLVECQTATCLSEKGMAYVIFQTTPTASISASSSTLCAGQPTTLTAISNCSSLSPNLLVNSGFENGAISPWWTGASTVTIVNNNARTGTYAASVIGNDVGIGTAIGNLLPNTTYTFSGYLKASTAGQNGFVEVGNYDGTGNWISSTTTSVGTTYTQFTVTFTTGATNTSVDVGVWRYGTGTIYADDFSLTRNTPNCTYSWSPGGATTSSITVNPTSTTTYTLTSGLNGCTTTASTTITVSGSAITVNSPTICSGQSTTLTATGCTGTVSWSNGVTASSITVSPTSNTTYTATCTPTAVNLLGNPNFETGALGAWGNWGNSSITSVSAERQNGTYGIKTDATSTSGGFGQDIAAVAGETFTVTSWGRVNNTTPWSATGIKFLNSSWAQVGSVTEAEINVTAFQQYTLTATAPAGTAWVEVYGWSNAGAIMYLDNFVLTKAGCSSSAVSTVTVSSGTPTPTATAASRCGTGTVTLTASGCTGTYNWYAAATGGSSLGTGASYTTPSISATTTYYVDCTISSCVGSRASAIATINAVPVTPTATVVSTGCTGSTGSITVTNLPDGYSTNINGGAWTQYKNSYVDLAAGTYTIGYQGGGCASYATFTVATSTDNPLLSLAKTDPTCSTTGSITVTGSGGTTGLGDVSYQLWYGISGNLVSNLTSNANYPNTPSFSTLLGIAEGYDNSLDNIGGKLSGYIVPPTTGTYYFWVASDDYSEFWGSGDANPANKVLLASVTGYTGYREWNKYASQKTVAINLTAGQIYYFEVLYKEGTGGDNISLGWAKPGEATTVPSEVIPGKYLRPNIASSTTTPVYQYKLNTGAFQTSNVFTGLAAGTYTVTIQDAGGCTTSTSITLAISGGITAPTGTGASRCGTGTVAILASGCTGTYNWYAASAGGTSLGTGATYTTPSISASTTYYVDCTVSSCVSSRTAVTATVNAIPSAPTGTGANRCGTGTVTLSASGCAGTYNWYATSTGGTSLGSAATYTTPSISASTTYYVDCTVSGCASSRASAVATINAQPANPAGSGSRCGTGTVVLTGTGCSGTYNWYVASTGGTSLGSNSTYTTPSISTTTTYYLSCTVGSCTSSIVPAVATVNAIPTAAASSNSPIVVGGTLNLFSTGGTTYSWVGPNGFTSNQQDVSSANLTALDAGTYTVTANTNGCTATATTQIVINNYDPGDIDCSLVSSLNFSSPTLISGTAGANNAQYRFSNVAAGTDAIVTVLSRSHTDVEIVDLDIPAATYGGYDAAFQPMIDYNWINSNGTYDAAGEKSITFKFDFVQSGTTTPKAIPNLLATGLDIDGSTNEVREFIQASNYQSYQIQTPSSLTLSGALKAKGPLTTYAGINELALDAMISYAYINSSSITVTYGGDWNGSTADFGDTAPGNSDEKRLNSLYFKCYNFNTTVCALPLATPTGTSATRCGTGSVTLSASGCTGTYYWYAASTGGLAIEVGSTFTTPSIATTTNYFVECNAAGCTSSRIAVTAFVKPMVVISKVLGDSECLNSDINLNVTASGGTNLTYNWTGPNSFVSTLQNPTRVSATASMAGTYSVTVSNAEGCAATATATVTVSSLPTASIAGTTTICNGQSTTLTASGGNYYIWGDGSTSAAITLNPTTTTSYSVTVYQNNISNTDLVTNITGFNAASFSLINATNSYGGPATLFDDVDNLNAETFHATRNTAGADWGISYNLGGNFLINSLSLDRRNDCCTDRAEGGVMQVWRNGTMVYQSSVLNSTGDGIIAATPAPSVIGNEIRYVFLAGANTLTGESVLNFTEWIIGGTKLCSTTATATVTVNAIPTAPTSAGTSRCGTGTVALSATGCAGGTISWYGALTGGTALTTGATYTTPSISATTTYYLECTLNGCVSSTRNSAVATINAIPTAPTSSGASRCGTGTVILSAAGCTGTYNWYNVASGGTSLGTASTYTTPSISATTTYYVDCTVGSCVSSRTSSVATVNAAVTATASSNAPICVGNAINLSATGGTSYLWSGPNSFSSTTQNPSLVASAATSGIYTVTVTGVGGCTATATTNVANPNITISNIVVSACINQPLQDVATVSMSIAWVNAPSSDKIKVTINNKTEYIDVAAGATSPQTITFLVPANGISNIPISAGWVSFQSGNCNTLASFNAPVACSVDNLNCEKILYLCGPDKPADGDAWDHGFMNYLTGQGATLTATYTKPDASGYGLYNPLSITTLMNINLNDYTSIIISPTTESNLATNLLTALKGYSGGILMMNYTEADDLGLTSTPASYSWQDNAYTNNTNSIKIYNYDNINPTYGNVVTMGNYLATADSYLWAGANNMSSATNGIYFYYTPTDAMAGVPATHGARVYLGYHMNGIYSNSQNGGVMPAPSSSYFSPTNHLTLEAKAYFDQAIKNITTGLSVQATGDTKCAGNTINLTSTGVGIVSYSWTGPSSFASTLQNPSRSSTTTAMSGIYTVTVTGAGGCTATATTNVVVNAIPTAPTSAGASRCSTGTVTMTASGCAGGTITWYGALTGGSALTTGTTYTTPSITATTTYYLECSLNGCVSTTRNSAVATVNSIPTASATGDTECVGSTINLASSGGSTYSWAGPNSFASTLQNPTLSSATTAMAGVYTVTVTSSAGCSATATANVVVNAIPTAPTSAGASRCGTGTLTMTASGCAGGTITWYGALTGGAALTTGTTYTTPSISTTTTYYLECSLNGCVSTTRNSAVATVNSIPTPTASATGACVGGTIALSATGGNTYSWTGPNAFNSTLQNPSRSSATTAMTGYYVVTVTSASGCTATTNTYVQVTTISASVSNVLCNNNGTLSTSTDDYFTFLLTPSGSLGGRFTVSAVQAGSSISLTLSDGSATGSLSYAYPVPLRIPNGKAGAGNVTLTLTDAQNPSCTYSVVVTDPGTCNANNCTGTTQTVSYSYRIPLSTTELTQAPINLPKFDNAGGTKILTKVDLKYGMNEVTTAFVENQAASSSNLDIAITGSESIQLGATTLKSLPINFTTSTTLPAQIIVPAQGNYAGDSAYVVFGSTKYSTIYRMNSWLSKVVDDIYNSPSADSRWVTNATGNATYDDDIYIMPVQTFSFYDSTSYTTPTDLTQFIGTGNIGLTATTDNNANFSGGGGNFITFQRTKAYAYATVTYSYVCCIAPTAASASSNSPICSGQNITLTASSTGGSSYSWAGPNGFTSTVQNPTITAATTARSGIYTVTIVGVGTCTATATVNVVVNAIPTAPTSAGTSRCGTGTVTMTASGCAGGTITWYGALTGGAALTTGTTYTTPSITATTTYYLECSLNGCVSTTRNSAVATVNSIPTATATGDTECVGSTVSLASSGGSTYSWAGPSSFASTLQNPTISSVTTAMSGVYTVTVTSSAGCSATATANVVVNTIPTAPTSAGASRCGTGTLTMTASGCAGGTITWYGALTGGSALTTGTTYTTPSITATTTYYLECSLNGCISITRNSAVATVNTIPTASATGDTECLGATITLSASGGSTYLWAGPNSFTSTSATPSIANAQLVHAGTYTVTVTSAAACSATATASVVVSSIAAPTTTGASLCGSGAVALSASGCGGTYNWYTVATGGTSISVGDSYITPIISSSTTYYVDCTVNGCVSPRASATATILATITATASSNSPYTSGGTLNLYGTGTGTYAWSGPSNFSSAQQNPVITNAGTDKVGTYTLTVTAANGCKAIATTYVTTTSGTGIEGNGACNDPIAAGTTKINASRTGICLGCSVTAASTVVNGNLGDYAEMTIGASIIGGGVAISVQDTVSDYPSGYYAGFTVQPVGNILSTSILSGITINTYLNGTLQETATSANGLLKLSILSGYGSLQRVGLQTTKNYDEIQIIANGGLATLLTGLRVFYAFEEPISCAKNCEQPISTSSFGGTIVSSRSGISGLLCLGSVTNTANVLDADSTNFAAMSLAIGALCQSALSVKANTSFSAGTHAGYVVANASGILSLNILSNIRIETYLNGVIRESVSANNSVVSVGLFNPTTNQTAISFKSSLSFDEVRIVVAGTVSLLTQLNVYYPFIRRDADGDGIPDCLDKCANGNDLADSNGDGVPDACTPEFPTVVANGDTVCVGQTIYLTSNATQTELLEDNKVCNDAIVGTGVRLNPSLTGICLGCTVSNGAAVIDGDLTNYTELAIGVSIIGGGTALSVQDTMRRYPAGNYAGFVVQPVGGLLDLSVLSSITIKTYLNGTLQESATIGNSLLGVSVLTGNGGLQKVGFIATKTYDEIQIIAGGGLASLLTGLRVYYAFEEPSSCWKSCEEAMKVSNFGASIVSARTGVSGLLCLGSVANSSRLIDSDTTNYASMNLAIGLVCQTAVSVKGTTTLPAGTHAGFVVENAGGLLSLSLLGNIKIETYLAGSLRESVTLNSNVVTVGLLNPSSPLTKLSFKTGQSFDEIRLVVYGTISLISQLNVYYPFIRRDADSDGIADCMDKCTGTDFTDTDGDGTPDICDATNTTLLTYSWTGPGGFTSNLQSSTRPNATTAMGGIYTLTITNSSGYVRTLTTNVTVSAYPTISATPSTVCAGGTISMTVSGAITYTWTGPGGFTSNEIIITRTNATTAMAGTYTIVASNYNTCNSTGTVAVTVNALPTAPVVANAARCDVGAITITATGCSGGTIQWYASQTGTTMLATGTSYSIASLSSSAVYFTSCTDANACVSSSRSYGVAAINSIPDATLTGIGSLCLGYQPTNNGKLLLTKFKSTDTFSYNTGSTYNSGTASAFAAIPTNGEIATGLSDPSTSIVYTVRIKNAENCTVDRTVTLTNQCSVCPAGYCEPSIIVKTK